MFYKNWPYWLKGGAISILVFVLVFIISLFIKASEPSCPAGALCNVILVIEPYRYALLPVWVIIRFSWQFISGKEVYYNFFEENIFLMFIASAVFYFIIGAIIGLIYGKIKNRK